MRSLALRVVFVFIALIYAQSHLAADQTAIDVSTTRIVSLVPNVTEILFDIGAGKQVVGVSDYCIYPSEARQRPHVGGLVNPSLEGVLQLRPSVVMLYRSQQDFATRLGTLGVKTELFQVDHLADLSPAISRIGGVTGHTTQAATLIQKLELGLQKLQKDGASLPRLRGIVIVSRDPGELRNIYQATFLSEVFEKAGGVAALPGATAVSREDIIRANPQIIIDFSTASSGRPDSMATEPVKNVGPWESLTTVDAVKNGRVYQWPDAHAMLLGSGVLDVGVKMQELLRRDTKQ